MHERDKQAAREQSSARKAAGIDYISGFAVERDALQLMAMIPDDRRNLTQRAFGDPVFERSALYRRAQEEKRI